MKLFGAGLVRVRFLTTIGFGDGTGFNPGDVAELEETLAENEIGAGRAERTSEPVGRAPSIILESRCQACGGSNSEYAHRCEHCGLRLR